MTTIDADGLMVRMALRDAMPLVVKLRQNGFVWYNVSGLWAPSLDRQLTEWWTDLEGNRVLLVNPSLMHHINIVPNDLPRTETTKRGTVMTIYP